MDAFEEYEQAVVIARELDDPEQLAWTLNNYASRAMATGWMDRALAAYREAERMRAQQRSSERSGFRPFRDWHLPSCSPAISTPFAHDSDEDAQLPPGIAMTQTAQRRARRSARILR